jgi:hypothetical protein
MELDLLAQIGKSDHIPFFPFAVVLLSDVFRKLRDFRRYRYCVLKATSERKVVSRFASFPKTGPPIHAAIVPILLHEVAHLAYRSNAHFVDDLKEMADVALDRFAAAAAKQAETGDEPVPGGNLLGIPFEQYDQDRLKKQLEEYSTATRNNPALLEEVTCDLISALAFVNLEADVDCFENLVPEKCRFLLVNSETFSMSQLRQVYTFSF